MFYVDTSVLIAALTKEAKTIQTQDWLGAQSTGDLAISEWMVTEVSAALSIKMRSGHIVPEGRADALAVFNQMCIDALLIWQVTDIHFRAAARFADQYQHGLRAGDALHLAVAADHGATIVTGDLRLVDAAWALGHKAALL